MRNIYIVETEVTHEKGVWIADERFHIVAANAIAAAQRIERRQRRKWNNVRVRNVNYLGKLDA